MSTFVIAYDVGTTTMKTCLFEIADKISLIADAVEGYPLHMVENGGVEQDPDDWWRAMGNTTRKVLAKSGIAPKRIAGLSFCGQMQGLVLVDKKGTPVRRGMRD